MTKQIILIFAVLCSVQVQANSRYTERDTVQHEFFHDATELFQPLQPVYLDGVVVQGPGVAIGLSVSPEVQPLFSERLLAAKTCSDV